MFLHISSWSCAERKHPQFKVRPRNFFRHKHFFASSFLLRKKEEKIRSMLYYCKAKPPRKFSLSNYWEKKIFRPISISVYQENIFKIPIWLSSMYTKGRQTKILEFQFVLIKNFTSRPRKKLMRKATFEVRWKNYGAGTSFHGGW